MQLPSDDVDEVSLGKYHNRERAFVPFFEYHEPLRTSILLPCLTARFRHVLEVSESRSN
jgi:hypothetical protein